MNNIAWIDINEREYHMSEISSTHLINILNHIYRGGGHEWFVNHEVADRLYSEAISRGLKPRISRMDLLNSVRDSFN